MVRRWLVVALVAACCRMSVACTCRPDHPQTHFCKSDFVILGRVQKLFKRDDFYDTYKVKIRTVFKQTPKAEVALKSGRLLTPSQDSLCGVTLRPQETYIITGHVIHLEAHINLCNYVTKWHDVVPRQRKGFRRLYEHGCDCKVNNNRRSKSPNTCVTRDNECYERYGICMHDRKNRCHWTRSPALSKCIQKQHFNGTYMIQQKNFLH